MYLLTLSAYSSIYSKLKDYDTKNKTHADVKYEWEKMAAALISASSCYQVLWEMKIVLAD